MPFRRPPLPYLQASQRRERAAVMCRTSTSTEPRHRAAHHNGHTGQRDKRGGGRGRSQQGPARHSNNRQ